MNNNKTVVFAVLLTVLSGCVQSSVDSEAEQAALRSAATKYHEAGSTSDIETVVALYATDGVILPPNAPAQTGPAAFRDFAIAFTGLPAFSMRFDTPTVEISAAGDMGYTLTDTFISFDGPDGSRVEDQVRDFHLWEKRDGEWKVVLDIWNSELPMPDKEPSSPIDGAWVVSSLQSPEGESIEPAGPSQFIFSDGRYSAIYTVDVVERPRSAATFAPTDEEKVAQYNTLIVNSGTFEIDSNRVIMRPMVAKSPEFIGGRSIWEYSINGSTLTGTIIELGAANGQAPADGTGHVITLSRAN